MSTKAPARRGASPRRPYTPRLPSAARRDQLLDAALQIIARDGYAAVSVEAIAREADVTRPVVYHVFAGLDDLLATLLDRQEQRALAQLLSTISAPTGDVRAWLRGVITDLVATVTGDPLTWRPIFLTFDGTPAVVRRRIGRAREQVRDRVERLAAAGLRGRPEIDPAVLSHILIAVGEYYGRVILDDPGSVGADRLAATVVALLPL